MTAYILRRSLYSIPILLGVCLVVFGLFHFVAGDPASVLAGRHASAQQIQQLRAELGLDQPLFFQYLDVVKSALTFDFGRSWASKQEVSSIIAEGLGPTLCISLPATLIAFALSVAISLVVAFFRGRLLDRFFVILTVGLMSISSLTYILFFQWFFAYSLGWFEISGFDGRLPHVFSYITLPMAIWIILSLGPDVRFYRTVLLDEMGQDYVRSARSKGMSEARVMRVHVLKNAMIPMATYLMANLPFLILGALLIETFFGIPGLGGIIYGAINNSDFPVLKAMTILTATSMIVVNLVTDILYTLLDPRVRPT